MASRVEHTKVAFSADGTYYVVAVEVPKVRVFTTADSSFVGVAAPNVPPSTRLTSLEFVPISNSGARSKGKTAAAQADEDTVTLLLMGVSTGEVFVFSIQQAKLICEVAVGKAENSAVTAMVSVSASAEPRTATVYCTTARSTVVRLQVDITGAAHVSGTAQISAPNPESIALTPDGKTLFVGADVMVEYAVESESSSSMLKLVKRSAFCGHRRPPQISRLLPLSGVLLSCVLAERSVLLWNQPAKVEAGHKANGHADGIDQNSYVCHRVLQIPSTIANVVCVEPKKGEAVVAVVAVTGEVFVWTLSRVVVAGSPDTTPLAPTLRIVSSAMGERVMAVLLHRQAESMSVMRGTLAAPRVEEVPSSWRDSTGGAELVLPDYAVGSAAALSSLTTRSSKTKAKGVMPTETVSDRFQKAALERSKTVADLPKPSAAADGSTGAAEEDASSGAVGAVGGVGLALYQGLHGNDSAVVLDLLDYARRNQLEMQATIRSIEHQYLLQLLELLGSRIAATSQASSLHDWLNGIMILRGRSLGMQEQQRRQQADAASGKTAAEASNLAKVLAPSVAHYRAAVQYRDPIAHLKGRCAMLARQKPPSARTTSSVVKGAGAELSEFPHCFVEGGVGKWKVRRVKLDADYDEPLQKKRSAGKKSATPKKKAGRKSAMVDVDGGSDSEQDELTGEAKIRIPKSLKEAELAVADEDGGSRKRAGKATAIDEGDDDEEVDLDDLLGGSDDGGMLGSTDNEEEDEEEEEEDEEGSDEDDSSADSADDDALYGSTDDDEEGEGDDGVAAFGDEASSGSDGEDGDDGNAGRRSRGGKLVLDDMAM